ncbi:hypothetical protein P4493_04835 [Bacillus thuringiensis]|uniref:Uncharacterized protein n=3 Tax=Bacillus thuringiensis TaxID=1428 RepID=A0A7D4DDT2_BACTU|nr:MULTISPECIES: hypothetical protein [Bacillus]EAO56856.1 hypothetical protein RBTH_07586 [Bacillus thuringiensis serovar israelensis ATCC 35646]MEC2534364.1 hypothetical protein [Bacillus cereus]MED1153681.1 hypothetical protein [Bacillus paranthracis]OUB09443.1 hypothetical protein BK708_33535 [Bacillus thuringiensis serovar yunnanensis]AFQ30001.1 hypothetical protein BTF1_29502 [Bacillus thuringiensis HD-789]
MIDILELNYTFLFFLILLEVAVFLLLMNEMKHKRPDEKKVTIPLLLLTFILLVCLFSYFIVF